MQSPCRDFCGCQNYSFDSAINTQVYIAFIVILIVIMVSLKIGTDWFLYKDYYPLKQKSPILCIVIIAFITIQIILYPLLFIFNYFTASFGQSSYLYSMIYYGLDGTIYFIYVLRALRIVYAHTTDSSRQNTLIFKLFKYEYILGISAVALMIFRMMPIYWNADQGNSKFFIIIQFNTLFSRQNQPSFLLKSIITQSFWILILLYCLKLQSLTHEKHSMKNQLILVIVVNLLHSIIDMLLLQPRVGNPSIIFQLCVDFDRFPVVEVTKTASLIVMFCYSGLYPLTLKKVYHILLPTGRNYGLTKTMRDFLLEPQFLDIFAKFLEHLDSQNNTNKHTYILQCWKKVMVLKFSTKPEQVKLQQIKFMLTQTNQFLNVFQSQSPTKEFKRPRSSLIEQKQKTSISSESILVKSLLRSIESLEQPLKLSEEVLVRYRLDINEKVEQLQKKLLERLDKIYKQKYHQTKSYYHLKLRLNFYKKVNVNMILMKMALMVETDELM